MRTHSCNGSPYFFKVMKDPDVNTLGGENSEVPGSTASSLLELVKANDPIGWQRLVRLYGPLAYSWCRRLGLRADDAADVVQEVFRAVLLHVADFQRDQGAGFRAWLWTIARNKVRDHWRRQSVQPEARGGSDAQQRLLELAAVDDEEPPSTRSGDRGNLLHGALNLIRSEFEERSWQAFWLVTVEGRRPAEVAEDLNMTVNAVYVAKSRILNRLRQEFGDILE